jgi:hypothetical protein
MNEYDKRLLEKARREFGETGEAFARAAIDIAQAVDWMKHGRGFVHGVVTWAGLLAFLFLSGAVLFYVRGWHVG